MKQKCDLKKHGWKHDIIYSIIVFVSPPTTFNYRLHAYFDHLSSFISILYLLNCSSQHLSIFGLRLIWSQLLFVKKIDLK